MFIMATVKVHAGDFFKGDANLSFGMIFLKSMEKILGEHIPISELQSVEIASEENVKKAGGTIGWGAVGAIALGPAGLLAGLLLGGKKKEITFVAKFKDGRKLLATTDSKSFTKLQSAAF